MFVVAFLKIDFIILFNHIMVHIAFLPIMISCFHNVLEGFSRYWLWAHAIIIPCTFLFQLFFKGLFFKHFLIVFCLYWMNQIIHSLILFCPCWMNSNNSFFNTFMPLFKNFKTVRMHNCSFFQLVRPSSALSYLAFNSEFFLLFP